MSNVIDRQAAIDVLKVAYWDNDIQSAKDDHCIVDAMTDWAIRQVKALPSAEPERKKGQWIWCTSSDHLKCSECGTRAPMYMDYADGDYQEWLSDFCPECGCEMKGFEEDE